MSRSDTLGDNIQESNQQRSLFQPSAATGITNSQTSDITSKRDIDRQYQYEQQQVNPSGGKQLPYNSSVHSWAENRPVSFGVNVCHPWLRDALEYTVRWDLSMVERRFQEWRQCKREGIEFMGALPVAPAEVYTKRAAQRAAQNERDKQEQDELIRIAKS